MCGVGSCGGGLSAEDVQFVHGVPESVGVDGFEEVVYAVGVEGLEGVLVVGGGVDDGCEDGDAVEDVEGESVGEVDVHEDEVGRGVVGEVFDAFFDGLQDGDDGGVGHGEGDESLEVVGGDGFVFYDDYFFHGGGGGGKVYGLRSAVSG